MNTQFTINTRALHRILCTVLAAFMAVAGLQFVYRANASAALLSFRSVQLSDSSRSGTSITSGVGSGNNVQYQVSFTTTTTAKSVIIDFCNQNPIIGDQCDAVAGMGAATGSAAVTGKIAGVGWTGTYSANQIKLASDGNAANSATPGAQVFKVTGINNPSTVGTFYARIYTYTAVNFSDGTAAIYSSPTAVGNYADYGGVALSTTNAITITARVQETLTFCVTKAPQTTWTTTNDCSDPVVGTVANQPALTLGHVLQAGGGKVLDPTQTNTAPVYSQLSTNATHGAVINLRNSNTTCGGLSANNGVSCDIKPANNGTAGAATPIAPGNAFFGIFVSNSTLDVNGVGTLTPNATYHDNAHVTYTGVDTGAGANDLYYGMDNTTAEGPGPVANGTFYVGAVTSPSGSTLAATTGPIYRVNNTYVFGASAALTTPAGIYTANLSMVATGTF